MLVRFIIKGGKGSGHHGHVGIPGHKGGSQPKGGIAAGKADDGAGTISFTGGMPPGTASAGTKLTLKSGKVVYLKKGYNAADEYQGAAMQVYSEGEDPDTAGYQVAYVDEVEKVHWKIADKAKTEADVKAKAEKEAKAKAKKEAKAKARAERKVERETRARGKILSEEEEEAADKTNKRAFDIMMREGTSQDLMNKTAAQLAQDTGVSSDDINDFMYIWSGRGKNPMEKIAIQMDAGKEFKIRRSSYVSKQLAAEKGSGNKPFLPSETQRQILRQMYDNTQSFLAKEGFDLNGTIRLYRGVGVTTSKAGRWTVGQSVPVTSNALSSWSADMGAANYFASRAKPGTTGVLLQMDIPVKSIFSTAYTGLGDFADQEFVVLGYPSDGKILELVEE